MAHFQAYMIYASGSIYAKFNRRVLEALIRAGAFDEFDNNRAGHLAELPTALRVAEQHGKMAQTGQNDLFSLPRLRIRSG